MSYLLYLDALGMQEHYNKNFKNANVIMNRIYEHATTAFSAHLPELGVPLKDLSGSSITIMNDSVFIHAKELQHLIHVAAKFTKMMFVPQKSQPPVAFRGSIAKTEHSPILEHSKNGNLSFSKLVVDNISAAMIADKKKVIGARILIPKHIIDLDKMKDWHIRYQSLVMDVKSAMKGTATDVLKTGVDDYYDIAWMLTEEDNAMLKIQKNLHDYWLNAIYNERATLHASASMVLFEACQNKKKGVETVLRVLASGLKKAGKLDVENVKKLKYSSLLEMSKTIKLLNDNNLFIPIEVQK